MDFKLAQQAGTEGGVQKYLAACQPGIHSIAASLSCSNKHQQREGWRCWLGVLASQLGVP